MPAFESSGFVGCSTPQPKILPLNFHDFIITLIRQISAIFVQEGKRSRDVEKIF